jgi:hypothetical protein
MHVAMDKGGTPVEEEVLGDEVDAEMAMHEAMEEIRAFSEARREGDDTDTALHENMEWGRDNLQRGSCGTDDLRHLTICMVVLQANRITDTGVLMTF